MTGVLELMERTGIVPVFYNGDAEVAANVVRACYKGGLRAFEFTNRGEKALEIFPRLVEMAAVECPEMVMGVGSIVDGDTCRKFVEAGAGFVVGPVFSGEVLEVCRAMGVPYIPGAATPTEIFNAARAVARSGISTPIVKVFPGAEVGGPGFVKAVLAPMPWLRLMVTGGVEPTEASLGAWFGAGVKCVGIGSNLFPRELIAAGKWDEISEICRRAIGFVRAV